MQHSESMGSSFWQAKPGAWREDALREGLCWALEHRKDLTLYHNGVEYPLFWRSVLWDVERRAITGRHERRDGDRYA